MPSIARRLAAAALLWLGAPVCTQGQTFVDTALAAAVRAELRVEREPTEVQKMGLTKLSAAGVKIADLRGIETLTGLEVLDLSENAIDDLEPLASLRALVFLDLSFNQVRDIRPLAKLENLRVLVLSYNHVTDASSLLALTALESVELSGNPLDDRSLSVVLPALRSRGVESLVDAEEPAGDEAQSAWTALGPPPDQGTSLGASSLAVAPSAPEVLYVATDGGLLRSDDDGRSWSVTRLRSRTSRVYVDAADPSTVYVDDLKSTDGGATWMPLELPGRVIAADPVQPGVVYAFREKVDPFSGTIEVSLDGGDSWQTGVHADQGVLSWQVAFHPGTGVVWAGMSAFSRMWLSRSADGGRSWVRVDPRGMRMIVPDPVAAGSLYGVNGAGVWHSGDQGVTWERRGGPSFANLDQLVVHPVNPDWMWVRNFTSGWFQSRNAGRSWSLVLKGRGTVVPHPMDGARAYLVETAFGAGPAFETRDGGRSWQRLDLKRTSLPVQALVFDAAGFLYAAGWKRAGRQFPVMLSSRDGGATWLQRDLTPIEGAIEEMWLEPGSGRLLGYLRSVGFLCSDDGGATWEAVRVSDSLPRYDVAGELVFAGNGVYLAVSPGEPALFRSDDRGASWRLVRSSVRAVAATAGGGTVFAADESGKIWRSSDGGESWEMRGQIAGSPVFELAVPAQRSASILGLSAAGVFRSTDGAATWQRLLEAEFQATTIPRLRFSPGDVSALYVVAGSELWASWDGGVTWADLLETRDSPTWVNDAAIHPAHPDWLYLATPTGVVRRVGRDGPAPVTAVGEEAGLSRLGSALRHNYPNPFNARTIIPYEIQGSGRVDLVVYDALGRPVRHLLSGEYRPGLGRVEWDGTDARGRHAASGVYFYVLTQGELSRARRLVLLR